MPSPLFLRLNPFERIRSTEGKVFWLLVGLGVITLLFDAFEPGSTFNPWWRAWQVAVMLIYIALGTFGTAQIVARPVRRAKRHFDAIARGDFSKPVLTRRTDEFGDMLRGLENMRQNLVDAINARDEAERNYRTILDRSMQGFYQGTEDGHLLAVNSALARMLGYDSTAQLLAEPSDTVKRMHVESARRELFVQQMRADGFVTGFEARLRRRDGGIIWVSESAIAVSDSRTGRAHWEGFLDDITARKEAEQLKSDFVSFVTHQLRTPLSGIRWMIELAEQADPSPEIASYLEDAHASAKRLIGLVNDLLDVARLEAGRLTTEAERIDVTPLTLELIDELKPLSTAKHQTMVYRGSNVAPMLGDPQLVRQAMMNLLSNAIKYTPDAGAITITASDDGSHVRWAVRDTGIGISVASQRYLFQKFFRADNAVVVDTEGTGLGLYLVRLIAERSGGSITCESTEGAGSTFILRLPVVDHRKVAA
jgi:PAS domain S-box-containing protein